MKNKQDNYGSLSHVLLFKDKHLMVFWNKDIHVYDTLNVKEIELYHMEHEIAKVRFSYDHSLIMAYAVGGQIYVINRKGNTISKGDCLKIRYSNKFYEPPYEESILMHINKDNGFVLVVPGNIKQKYINDWYYLDKNGYVIKTCSFTEIDKNDCNLDESTLPVFNRVINNPDEDDCYILGYAFFPYIYKFDPETSNVTKLFHIGWNQRLKSLDYLEIRPDNLFIKRDLFVFSGINKKGELVSIIIKFSTFLEKYKDNKTKIKFKSTKFRFNYQESASMLYMYYDDIYAMLDLNDYEIKEIPIKYIPKINNKRFPFKQYSGLSIFRFDNTLICTNVEYFDLYDIRDDTLLIHFKSRQYIK